MLKNFKNALSPAEMRDIKGGLVLPEGSCGYRVVIGGYAVISCNVTKDQATSTASAYGGNWCCDSCGTSSYCAGGGPA